MSQDYSEEVWVYWTDHPGLENVEDACPPLLDREAGVLTVEVD